MAFFNFGRWLRSRPRVKTYRNIPSFVPWFETLEDRTLLSTLPAAVVANPTTIASGFSPDVVQDPSNPLNLVEVQAGGTFSGNYSTDGGNTWKAFPAIANIVDPEQATSGNIANPPKFAEVTNATAAWDRGENIYITDIERSADDTSGAVVFQRYSFATGKPVSLISNTVLERWFNTDPILNPVVAVDNNLTSYTDTTVTPNTVQTDTMATLVPDPNNPGVMMAKAIYVAWNTNQTAPTGTNVIPGFTPNVIKALASSDGGVNFTSPEFVTNGKNVASTGNSADPQIVFTQGSADGTVTGGQLIFVWDKIGGGAALDASQPDGGVATTKVADSTVFTAASVTGVSTVTLVTAGTGYSIGDILTVKGGTGVSAELQVTSVNAAGGILTLTVYQGGVYTVQPANPPTLTGGTGSGAAVNLTFTQVSFVSAVSVTPGFAGTGYAVGDILTVAGGVQAGAVPTAAQVEVTAISVPVSSAVLVAGGSNYVAGDVLDVTGGVSSVGAVITVGTVDASGAILTYTVTTPRVIHTVEPEVTPSA